MPTQTLPDTNTRAFVNLRLLSSQLIDEELKSHPAHLNNKEKQAQLRIETSSGFSVGINDPLAPKNLMIEIQFQICLKSQDSERLHVEYNAKHTNHFLVEASTGVNEWMDLPTNVLSPYFAIVFNFAAQRAEDTFVAMGIRGVSVPRPANFDDDNQSTPSQESERLPIANG